MKSRRFADSVSGNTPLCDFFVCPFDMPGPIANNDRMNFDASPDQASVYVLDASFDC